MAKVTPLGDRVLVKRLDEEKATAAGIILPDIANEKSMEAKVVSLGTGKKSTSGNKIPFLIKKGDTVLVGKYTGTEVKIDGEDYVIVEASSILVAIE